MALSPPQRHHLGCSTAFRGLSKSCYMDFGRLSTTRDDSFHADRFDRSAAPPSRESRPFGAIKKLRVSPRIVARFVAGSLLSLKSTYRAPRHRSSCPPILYSFEKRQDNIVIARSRHGPPAVLHPWKKNMLHVEDLRTRLGQLPCSPSSLALTFALLDSLLRGPGTSCVTSRAARL